MTPTTETKRETQMSELHKNDAQRIRNGYVATLTDAVTKIEEHFQNMDFQNAKEKDDLATALQTTKQTCQNAIYRLTTMNFQ